MNVFEKLLAEEEFDNLDVSKLQENAVETAKSKMNKQIISSIKSYIKANEYVPPKLNLDEEVSKRLPPPIDIDREVKKRLPPPINTDAIIEEATRRALINLPKSPPPPPQIIRYKVIEKIEEKVIKLEEEKLAKELNKEIERIKKELTNMKEVMTMVGGSGVVGLPTLEGNSGKVLSVVNNQPKWITNSGGGSSSDAYTPTNITTTRSYNATLTSLDEIANVLGSLIASLQGAGIIQ